MSIPDTLLVDGHDLRTLPGIIVESLELFAPGRRRGENDVIPGRPGALGFGGPFEAYAFAVAVTVTPADAGGVEPATDVGRRVLMLDNLRGLAAALAGAGGLVTLTRRLATATGYDAHTAAGQYVDGLAVELLNPETGSTELQFVNLDGAWWDGTTWLVP